MRPLAATRGRSSRAHMATCREVPPRQQPYCAAVCVHDSAFRAPVATHAPRQVFVAHMSVVGTPCTLCIVFLQLSSATAARLADYHACPTRGDRLAWLRCGYGNEPVAWVSLEPSDAEGSLPLNARLEATSATVEGECVRVDSAFREFTFDRPGSTVPHPRGVRLAVTAKLVYAGGAERTQPFELCVSVA